MERYCVLFNPKAGHGNAAENAENLLAKLGAEVSEKIDVTSIENYETFFAERREEKILLCGGDGTLNRFANDTAELELSNEIFYCAAGSGNDFLRDVGKTADELVDLKPYLRDLPICEVRGKRYRFVNGIGYGIDGYCCEEGDRLRAENPGKAINYTSIAIKGLLFAYKPTGATVTVDGKEYRFKKVWIAPTMNGRYYGGGMMAAPSQDRLSPEGLLSLALFHNSGKLRTLMVFPKIFKGEHLKSKIAEVLTGHTITVEFDEPRPLQLDGETIVGVKKYTAIAVRGAAPVAEKESIASLEA